MKIFLFAVALSAFVSSNASAQFNWTNWNYPTGNTATTSVGAGTVSLTVTGSPAIGTADFPVIYQGNPFTQLSGDSAGAQSAGSTGFQMELDFTGFATTAGLTLAIGNIAHVSGFFGYQMSALDSSNNPINLATFSQYGHFDYTWTANSQMFNDDLLLNTNNGKFHVTTIAGQDNLNSDMLIFSLPANVSKIFVVEQNPTQAINDTINFMLAPVPEPSTYALFVMGGLLSLWPFIRRLSSRPKSVLS